MSEVKMPEFSRRRFLQLMGAATSTVVTPNMTLPSVSLHLSPLLTVLQEYNRIGGLYWQGIDEVAMRLGVGSSPEHFDKMFIDYTRRTFEAEIAYARIGKIMPHVLNDFMNSDESWNSLSEPIQSKITSIVAEDFDNYPEEFPNSTIQQRRNLASALYQLANNKGTRPIVDTDIQSANKFLDSGMWDKVADFLEIIGRGPSNDASLFEKGFKNNLLEFAADFAKDGMQLSPETFTEIGLSEDFGTYEDFMQEIKQHIEKRAIEMKEKKDSHKAELLSTLSDPDLLIVHRPRSANSEFSEGLVESYHLLDAKPSPKHSGIDSPCMRTFRALGVYYSKYSDLRAHGIYASNFDQHSTYSHTYLTYINPREIHIVDPPRALKILLDEAMKKKSPPTTQQML